MGDSAPVLIPSGDPALIHWAAVLSAAAANDVTPNRLDVLAARTGLPRLSVDGIEVFLSGHDRTPVRFRR